MIFQFPLPFFFLDKQKPLAFQFRVLDIPIQEEKPESAMIHTAVKLSRAGATVARTAKLGPSLLQRSPPSRLVHDGINSSNANPVALQMINYALSHARSQKSGPFSTLVFSISHFFQLWNWILELKFCFNFGYMGNVDESYAQGLLVLEQCLSTQPSEGQDPAGDNSRGMVLLAMSTLSSERFFLFSFLLGHCKTQLSSMLDGLRNSYLIFQRKFWWSNG